MSLYVVQIEIVLRNWMDRTAGRECLSHAFSRHDLMKYVLWWLLCFVVFVMQMTPGGGLALYFRFLRTLTILMLMMLCCSLPALIITSCVDTSMTSIYQLDATTLGNIATPLIEAYTQQHNNKTIENIDFGYVTLRMGTNRMSISKQNISIIMTWCDCAACVVFLAGMIWLMRQQTIQAQEYARTEVTVQQYTVQVNERSMWTYQFCTWHKVDIWAHSLVLLYAYMRLCMMSWFDVVCIHVVIQVRGLPPTFSDRLALRDHFTARFGPVVDIAIACDHGDLIALYEHRGRLKQQQDGMLERLRESMELKIEHVNDAIDAYHQKYPVHRTVAAFVTFERQADCAACLTAYDQYYLALLTQHITTTSTTTASLAFQGSILTVTTAPEPSNILFHNIRYSRCSKWSRRVATTCLYATIMLLSMVVVFISQYYQQQVSNDECVSAGCMYAHDTAMIALGSWLPYCYVCRIKHSVDRVHDNRF